MTKEEFLDAGMTAALRGENDKAIEQLEEALRIDPCYVPALNQLGLAFIRAGRYEAAEKTFDHILDIAPYNGSFHLQLGNCQFFQGRYDEALQSYKRAEAIDKDNAKLMTALTRILHILGRGQEAFLYGVAAAEKDPGSFLAHYYLGLTAKAESREDIAAKAFLDAAGICAGYIAVQSEKPEGYFLMGEIETAIGNFEKAAAEYEKAASRAMGQESFSVFGIRFTRLDILTKTARAFVAANDRQSALRYAKELRRFYPDAPEAQELARELGEVEDES